MMPRLAQRIARKWVTKERGGGFVVVFKNSRGEVFEVEPTDPVNGDDMESVRYYIATNALPGDLYYEGGRPFVVHRVHVLDRRAVRVVEETEERFGVTTDGEPCLLMRRGLV